MASDLALQAGFTADDGLYPAYVNVRSVDTRVYLTLRGPAAEGRCGETIGMELDEVDWLRFLGLLATTWKPTPPP